MSRFFVVTRPPGFAVRFEAPLFAGIFFAVPFFSVLVDEVFLAITTPDLPAEGVGFEPTEALRPQRFSRPPHSSALPPLRAILGELHVIVRRRPNYSWIHAGARCGVSARR